MKTTSVALLVLKTAIATALLFLSTTILFGQEKLDKLEKVDKVARMGEKMKNKEFCSGDTWSNGDRVSFKELREMTLPASGSLAVDGGKNGGIKVKGSDRSDILVRACVQTWGTSEEAARAAAGAIRISTAGTVKAEGAEENASVSFEVLVPRSIDLNLKAHNGGISIGGVRGRLEFETINGGLHLSDIGGDVRGRTTNGGVHVNLAGARWDGSGLDLVTTNGGVHVNMAEGFAANIETGTTNGGFHSDVPGLSAPAKDDQNRHQRATRINTSLNGGGAPIRLMTTNGGVHFSSASKTAY